MHVPALLVPSTAQRPRRESRCASPVRLLVQVGGGKTMAAAAPSSLLRSSFFALLLLAALLLRLPRCIAVADANLASHGVERRRATESEMRGLKSAHGRPGSRPPQCHDECRNCRGECSAKPVYLDRNSAHGHAVWTCTCLY